MPVDVAVKHPDTWIIRYKANDEVSLWWENKSISSRWERRELSVIRLIVWDWVAVGVVVEGGAVCGCSVDDLECVAVQMEGVGAAVVVVEDYLDYVVVFEDNRVRKFAV